MVALELSLYLQRTYGRLFLYQGWHTFLLLRYSVLFTVESLYLLYLLFYILIYMFRRLFIDKLWIFHVNQTSMSLDLHQN